MPDPTKRKVFISWSKQPTDDLAIALKELLLHMFDNVEPFVSKEIDAGVLSIPEIFNALSGSEFAFLLVTRKNQREQWLNFEAGALAKAIADGGDMRVVPLLVDFESIGQLDGGPIANLQARLLAETELLAVVDMLARLVGVDAATVRSRWDAAWSRFAAVLKDVQTNLAEDEEQHPEPERSAEDMLAEVLALVRGQNARRRMPSGTSRETDERMARMRVNARRALLKIGLTDVEASIYESMEGVHVDLSFLEEPSLEARDRAIRALHEALPHIRISVNVITPDSRSKYDLGTVKPKRPSSSNGMTIA